MNMKKRISWLTVIAISVLFSSCATIIGGAKYNAKVLVPNHPKATISYNGEYKGMGEANFKVKRRDADQVMITVQDEGYEPQTQAFMGRVFRGWSFLGTALGWSGFLTAGETTLFIPWGIAVDAITGAWWKPDTSEKGISKEDFDHFIYTIPYDPVKLEEEQTEKPSEYTSE